MPRAANLFRIEPRAERLARHAAIDPDRLHGSETAALRAITRVGGFTVEHLAVASWRINGVTVDRWLFCEIAVAASKRGALPAWFVGRVLAGNEVAAVEALVERINAPVVAKVRRRKAA